MASELILEVGEQLRQLVDAPEVGIAICNGIPKLVATSTLRPERRHRRGRQLIGHLVLVGI